MAKLKLVEKTPKSMKCWAVGCPALFATNRKSYMVVGKRVARIPKQLQGRIGKNEILIEVPKALLKEI